MALDNPTLIKRLTFVRYLFDLGVKQVVGPFPSGAVLCFHDAIEIFLNIGIEHAGGEISDRMPFMELFGSLAKVAPALEGKALLRAVNDARKLVKHAAQEISDDEVRRNLGRTRSFLEQNSIQIFQIDLFSLSLADGISNEQIRSLLQNANVDHEAGNYRESVMKSAHARVLASRSYGLSPKGSYSSYNFDKSFMPIVNLVSELDSRMAFLILGIDPRKQAIFNSIVPGVSLGISPTSTPQFQFTTSQNATEKGSRFCIDFVVDLALKAEQANRELQQAILPDSNISGRS